MVVVMGTIIGVLGVGSWSAFVVLDRMFDRVGGFVAPVRTIALAFSSITTPMVVAALIFVPAIVVTSIGGVGAAVGGASVFAASCAAVGAAVERRANRAALQEMSSDSPVSLDDGPPDARTDGTGTPGDFPRFVITELSEAQRPDPFIDELDDAQRTGRRRRDLRRRAPPAVGLFAIVLWTTGASSASVATTSAVIIVVIIVGVGAILGADRPWASTTLSRSPLRELRLGARVGATMLLFVPLAILRVQTVARSSRDSVRQWSELTIDLGRISNPIRSGLMAWAVAAIVSPFVVATVVDASAPAVGSVVAAAAFLMASFLLARWDRATAATPERRWGLLVLRVFGSAERSRFLLHVADRWADVGPASCIAAPDVSIHQISAGRLVDTLYGMDWARFVIGPGHDTDVEGIRPLPARYLEEVHCFADAWRSRVRWEAALSGSVVLMDLRGFGPERRGCAFELGVLVDEVPIDSVVVLVDETTDVDTLTEVLTASWATMRPGSPNQTRAPGDVAIFRTRPADSDAAQHVVRALATATRAAQDYNCWRGREYLDDVRDSLGVLAAAADEQLAKFRDHDRIPMLVLDRALTFDRDVHPGPSYLLSWGLIEERQAEDLEMTTQQWEEIMVGEDLQTVEAMTTSPEWRELRLLAATALVSLAEDG